MLLLRPCPKMCETIKILNSKIIMQANQGRDAACLDFSSLPLYPKNCPEICGRGQREQQAGKQDRRAHDFKLPMLAVLEVA